MTKNQNDNRHQQPDSKSHLEKTQEGKKTEELDPNNPKAQQNNQPGSQQSNQQRKDSNSNTGKSDSAVMDNEENEEDITNEKTSGNSGDQNSKKGNM